MALSTASSRIISLKRILSYTLLVELYNVTVILLDTALHSDSPLKGLGFRKAAGMFVQTIIPDVIIILMVFFIVCYITRRSEWLLRHPFLKIASDVILSVATAFTVYRLFYIVVLWHSPRMKLNWNEAFMNVTLILLIVEIIYYAHNYRDTVKKVNHMGFHTVPSFRKSWTICCCRDAASHPTASSTEAFGSCRFVW